ncbi:MAG: PilZ domain-containing protein [Sedimenticola sp.]
MSDNNQYTEHRASERSTVQDRIGVTDINSGEEIGHLANISLGGFMLISNRQLPLNSLFQLRLDLPSTIDGVGSIDLGAESLWSHAATDAETVWTGFHIIDIADRHTLVIGKLIDSWTSE